MNNRICFVQSQVIGVNVSHVSQASIGFKLNLVFISPYINRIDYFHDLNERQGCGWA